MQAETEHCAAGHFESGGEEFQTKINIIKLDDLSGTCFYLPCSNSMGNTGCPPQDEWRILDTPFLGYMLTNLHI